MKTNNYNLVRPILPEVARAMTAILLLLAALSMVSTGASATLSAPPSPSRNLDAMAINQVALRNHVAPGDLTIFNSTTAKYPLQGKTLYEYKVANKRTGVIYGAALDAAGKDLDAAKVQADEQAAYTARYGKLEPELADLLLSTPTNQVLSVIIWLKEPSYKGPQRQASDAQVSEEQVDAFYAQVDAQRADAVQRVVGPVATRMAQSGYATTGDLYAPLLYALLTPSAIKQISRWSEVDRVYLSKTNEPTVDSGRATIRADVVHLLGYNGMGVKLGETEVGGGAATTNPYLGAVTQDPLNACTTSHSTAVAGIIASTHSTIRGIAPGANLMVGGSCSGVATQLQDASTRAANWGARAINLSWGTTAGQIAPDGLARFYDTMVFNRRRTIVAAAGNRGNQPDHLLINPALAYNIITVGSFDDWHTSSWTDDTMSSFSSYKNPTTPHGDREKPEIVAPGSSIHSTTTSSPWTGTVGSGTSFAAPMVTGDVGLLLQRNPLLAIAPETVKAILMAAAVNDIDGTVELPFVPGHDTKDGAGGISVDRADNIAHGAQGNAGSQDYDCGPDTSYKLDATTMKLTAGVKTRIVLTWSSNPAYSSGYSGSTSQPSVDLDMGIMGPGGSLVAGSGSWDNNFEIVEFTPSITDYYTLQVIKYRCDLTPAYIGWAWYKG